VTHAKHSRNLIETGRLVIRELDATDHGDFILDLLNRPSFIRYIGDRGVRTLRESRDFIENRYRPSYRENGFGLYAVELKEGDGKTGPAIGICGFVRREGLTDPDIGFAFLSEFEGRGYAFESASAVLEFGRETLDIARVMAITTIDNENSVRLLGKLGFVLERRIVLPGSDDELNLFVRE
jgi:RimJ/RimL family protein N-acetyltransferase